MGLLKHICARSLGLRSALVLLITCGLTGAAVPVSESQLKAVFLFNFAHFVEWPAAALPHGNAPFVIGVLGRDSFGNTVNEVVRGETVNGRPLAVERYPNATAIRDCQILFIPASELAGLADILAAIKGRSVLTVTDADGPAPRGVIIGLIRQDNRIRLRIDLEAAKASNLTISSKLLRPAEIVRAGS
jgi:uncharacterized protein DUF4154